MKTLLLFLSFVAFTVVLSWAQRVNVVSYEHALRWATENRFPNYFNDAAVKDSVFSNLSTTLKTYLKTDQVTVPSQIKYRLIEMFGKAKNAKPDFNSASPDYQVSVLSFITRATSGFAMEWSLDVKIYRGNKTVFDKSIHHEIEYFSSSGVFTAIPWFSKEEFVHFLSDMTGELFGTIPALGEKVIVGSPAIFEAGIYQWIPEAKRVVLKTNGSWKTGAKFSLAIQQDSDTLSSLLYREGFEIGWPKLSMASATAHFFSELTGLNIGYTAREKVTKYGRVQSSRGPVLRLRMEWIEATEEYTKSTDSYTQKVSPVVAELYNDDVLQGHYTYYRTAVSNISGNGLNQYVDPLATHIGTHFVYGMMLGQPIRVKYEEDKVTISLGNDQKIRAAVVMLNMNPDSRGFSDQKLSKDKKSVTSSSIGSVSADQATEWYYFYYDPSLSEEDLNFYLQSLVCLFAGMGT